MRRLNCNRLTRTSTQVSLRSMIQYVHALQNRRGSGQQLHPRPTCTPTLSHIGTSVVVLYDHFSKRLSCSLTIHRVQVSSGRLL